MNWTEISVAISVAVLIFGWLKSDNIRLNAEMRDMEKKIIRLETILDMLRNSSK